MSDLRRGAEEESSRQRARRSLSRSRRRRRRSRSRSRSERRRQERRDADERRAQREPSNVIVIHGIPESGLGEDRLEKVTWELSVKAGTSMPNSVQFQHDPRSRRFKGTAHVEFPHKEAAKQFKEHTKGFLEVLGNKLLVKYYHPPGTRSRSPSREYSFREKEDPSVTIMVKGVSATTTEASIATIFQEYGAVKDIRHFPRRGFAFVQYGTVDEACNALTRFEKEHRNRVDGERVVAHFAKEREDGRQLAERSFLQQQAQAAADATAELEKMAAQQAVQEVANKALSGVNAGMWASYMQSVAQTETVQSANTFQYDKETGYYKDTKAGLFYDPNSTYFFTTDCKKYFVYCHEEEMLCLVNSQGAKVPGGERRELPSQASKSRGLDSRRDRDRDRERERRRSRSRRRERSCSPPRWVPPSEPVEEEEEHKPIYFPEGDPLAKLAPAPGAMPKAVVKKKRKPEEVEGLAPLTDPRAVQLPGPVTVFRHKKPGPVKLAAPPPDFGQASGSFDPFASVEGASFPPQPPAVPNWTVPQAPQEWICEICMRKFATEEQLRRHEQLSDLHKQNLAKLQAAY